MTTEEQVQPLLTELPPVSSGPPPMVIMTAANTVPTSAPPAYYPAASTMVQPPPIPGTAMAGLPPILPYVVVPPHPQPVFGTIPVVCRCPYCSRDQTTTISYEPGLMTFLAAGGLCLIGCSLGCCLIPFCLNDTRDVIHSCSACKSVIGKYSRLS